MTGMNCMTKCAAQGCFTLVRRRNRTGLCLACNKQRRAEEAERHRRYCAVDGCGKHLHYTAINDVCAYHLRERMIQKSNAVAALVYAEMKHTKDRRAVAEKLGIGINRVNKLAERSYQRPARSMASIIRCAAAHGGITMQDIVGACRAARLVRIRHVICLIGVQAGHSTPAIGRAIGRDHSTVIHGKQQAEERIKRDADFTELVLLVTSGVMPEQLPVQDEAQVEVAPTIEDLNDEGDPSPPPAAKPIGPICQDILRRIEARNAPRRRIRAKNDFRAMTDADDSHQFHAGVAAGSAALYRAIVAARAA